MVVCASVGVTGVGLCVFVAAPMANAQPKPTIAIAAAAMIRLRWATALAPVAGGADGWAVLVPSPAAVAPGKSAYPLA